MISDMVEDAEDEGPKKRERYPTDGSEASDRVKQWPGLRRDVTEEAVAGFFVMETWSRGSRNPNFCTILVVAPDGYLVAYWQH